MMRRDPIGWLCEQHGRVTFHQGERGERAAARHLIEEHPRMAAQLAAAELRRLN